MRREVVVEGRRAVAPQSLRTAGRGGACAGSTRRDVSQVIVSGLP